MTHGPRPVWLFSLDSENFHAAPTTTGGLIAWYRVNGSAPAGTDFRQVHFRERGQVAAMGRATSRRNSPPRPAMRTPQAWSRWLDLSFYTWNAAEFLELTRLVRAACPQILIVAGGPHVQQAEDVSRNGSDRCDRDR